MINYTSFRRNARKTPENGQQRDMGILNDLLSRVQSVNDGLQTGELVRDVVVQHPDDILELQKIQLFQGLNANGEDIRPYYTEDLKPGGYFYSVESAKRYAAWKESGINYPYSVQRNPDAPNLYINGRFHDELGVQFDVQTVGIVGTTGYSKGIIAKYGVSTFGLMMANWMVVFVERGAYNELMNEIRTRLYGNY
jgi:hypothetical protein